MSDNFTHSSYLSFGKDVFGPFLLGFAMWLHEKIKDLAPDKVIFLSRDGYLMQRAFEIVSSREPLGIPYEYAYFSRRSLRAPLLWTKEGFAESFDYFSWQRFVSVSEVLAYWGISDFQNEIDARMNVRCSDIVIPFENMLQCEVLSKIFDGYRECIFKRSRTQFDALRVYFDQIGMRGRVVIVDIGWHGTMQFCLERMIEACGINVDVTGLYVGIEQSKPLKGKTFGFVYEKSSDLNKTKILCFFGVVEKLFQSFEGSTSGYAFQSDMSVRPTLDAYEYPKDDSVVADIRAMQNGALDFVRSNPNFNGVFLSPFLRVAMRPSLAEVSLFRGFYNIDNGIKTFFLPQKSLFRYSPREFMYSLSQSPWKTGFLKLAFKLPLPYYSLYRLLKK